MNNKVIFQIKKSPFWGNVFQIVCLALIIPLLFRFNDNPLLSSFLIGVLLLLFFLRNDWHIYVYDDCVVFFDKRTFSFLSNKQTVFFKDICHVEINEREIFYPGFLLGAASALAAEKDPSLILHFKNGTYKKITLMGEALKYRELFEIILSKIQ